VVEAVIDSAKANVAPYVDVDFDFFDPQRMS